MKDRGVFVLLGLVLGATGTFGTGMVRPRVAGTNGYLTYWDVTGGRDGESICSRRARTSAFEERLPLFIDWQKQLTKSLKIHKLVVRVTRVTKRLAEWMCRSDTRQEEGG